MARILYISYDGILDPLGRSQILPYIKGLSKHHELNLFSFEKSDRTSVDLRSMRKDLEAIGVGWHYTWFRKGPIGTVSRIVLGLVRIFVLVKKYKPDWVHLRGLVPMILYRLSLNGRPFLYDFRGFALEEWVEMGKLSRATFVLRLLRIVDRDSVNKASGIVVLDESARKLLKEEYPVSDSPIVVIPTCPEVGRYLIERDVGQRTTRPLRFVFLGGARFPYRPDLALLIIKDLVSRGYKCTIDFINEFDHDPIKMAVRETETDINIINIMSVNYEDIPPLLEKYDFGLLMIETSKWRNACCPTKLGEYFSAGIPVLALEGISVSDRLSKETRCLRTVSLADIDSGIPGEVIDDLNQMVSDEQTKLNCRKIALANFDMTIACDRYLELYEKMNSRLN